jgi:ribosome-associated protein YbcJ (S4-like RNA binding protein)
VEDVAVTGVITLGQLLKLAGIVDTGGEVKPFLASVAVRVNGEAEDRRGRKLAPGDVVEIEAREPLRLVRAT